MNRLRTLITRTSGGSITAAMLAYALVLQVLASACISQMAAADPFSATICHGVQTSEVPANAPPDETPSHSACVALCQLAAGHVPWMGRAGFDPVSYVPAVAAVVWPEDTGAVASRGGPQRPFARGPPAYS